MAKQQVGLPITPNDYVGLNQSVIPVKMIPREPTANDKKYRVGQVFIVGDNPSTGTEGDIWYLARFESNGDAVWSRFIGTDDYASTTEPGIIEIATDAEAVAGSSGLLALVPSNIAAILAEPPAIGGTTPAAITGTNISGNTVTATTGTFDEAVMNDGLTAGNGGVNRNFTINGVLTEAILAAHTEGANKLSGVAEARYTDTAALSAHIMLLRSRGTEATPTVVQSGDQIADIAFCGYNGSDYSLAAQIICEVNGTPGSNDMPGKLRFMVSPDGSETPANALVINQDKSAVFSGTVSISGQTQHAVAVFGASGLVDELGPLTDGQLLIGSTGSAPSAATITAGDNITITNGAGSIQIDAAGGLEPGDSIVSARALSTPEFIGSPGVYLKADYPLIGDLVNFGGNAAVWSSVTNSISTNRLATDGAGVWLTVGNAGTMTRSTDNGANWSSVTSGFGGANAIQSIATDKLGIWLAGATNSSDLRRSTDNGVTWSAVSSGFSSTLIRGLATDEASVWVAGSGAGEMKRSTNDGVTWSSVTSGFGSNDIYDIATNGLGVWVAVGISGTMTRSTDNGATWSAVTSEFINKNISGIATDGAGVWVAVGIDGTMTRSTDNGVTWSAVNSGFSSKDIIKVSTDEVGVWVAVGIDGTMTRSMDNGVSWQIVTSGFGSTSINDIKVGSSNVWVAGGDSVTLQRSEPLGGTDFYISSTFASAPRYLYTGETP